MKKHYLTVISAAFALGAQAQSISPGGIYAAANATQTPNGGLEWVLGNINSFVNLSTLPVKLIRFEGQVINGNVARLEWETAEEFLNAGFEIQKSADGHDFQKVGFVDGAGTTKKRNYYSFDDPGLTTTMYYRLSQIDQDGQRTLSSVITMVPPHESLDLFKAYPNPTHDGKMTLVVPERTLRVTLWDKMGKQREEIRWPKGKETIVLPADGMYILHIESVAGQKTLPVVRE